METPNVEQVLQNAIKHHTDGRLEQAKAGYNDIILSGSNNPHARHNLALIKISENNVEEALELLEDAKAIDSSVEQFWITELNLLLKLQKWQIFIDTFKSAVKNHRTLNIINCAFEFNALRAIVAAAPSNTVIDFIKYLKTVIKNEVLVERLELIGEDEPFALDLCKVAKIIFLTNDDKISVERMFGQKKYKECLDFLNTLLNERIDTECYLVAKKASCLVQLKRDQEAKAICLDHIEDDKTTGRLHNIFASILVGEQNYRDAEIYWKKALSLDPDFTDAYFNLGKMYDFRGDLRSASMCYSEAISRDAAHAGALFSTAIIYHKAKNYDKAIEFYHKTLAVNDKNYRCALSLASLYIEREMYKDAKILIDHVGDKDHSYFRYQVSGNYFAKTNRHKRALKFYKKAIKLNPTHVEILHSMALSHMQNGEPDAAIKSCVLALENSKYMYLPSWDLIVIGMGCVDDSVALQYFVRLEKGCVEDHSKDQLIALSKALQDQGLNASVANDVPFSFIKSIEASVSPAVFTLKNFGRSGTGMFHSLIDGHQQIVTTPSIYFSEFFHPNNVEFFLKNGPSGIVDKLFEKYPSFFDSRRPEPVDTIGHAKIYSFGLSEGLVNLGESKKEHIEINREEFREWFNHYLGLRGNHSLGDIFIALNLAYDAITFPDHDIDKQVLFYHIHNPSRITELHMMEHLRPKNIILVREPLQSMESWVTKPFNEDTADYTAITSRMGGILSHVSTNRYASNSYYGLRLEDIKLKPETTLKSVCNFLNVTYQHTMLNMTSAGKKWWGDPASPDYAKEGSSPFGVSAINRKLGKVFSEDDLYFFEILLHPFKSQFNYEPINSNLTGSQALNFVEKKIDLPLDFELKLCEKNKITPGDLALTGQYRYLRRRMWHRFKELQELGDFSYKLLKIET